MSEGHVVSIGKSYWFDPGDGSGIAIDVTADVTALIIGGVGTLPVG